LNFTLSGYDQGQALSRAPCVCFGGQYTMQSIRPENTDPIPLRVPPPRMGTIMIRFVGLLVVAVAVLALIWSR
jgi:hypothetical protein